MSVAWHPTRSWDWHMPEDEKQRQNQFLLIVVSIKVGDNKIWWKEVTN